MKGLPVLSEDWNSVPRSHTRQLVTAQNSSSGGAKVLASKAHVYIGT